jgi:diacylglycerol kinase (ATP)
MRAALDVLPERTAFPVDLELNGAETLHLEIYSLIVSNGRYVAAGIPAAPAARLDDGLLDLLILPAASLPQIALLVPQILLGRHMESDLLIYRKVTRLEIRSSSPMVFNVDGEVLDEAPSRIEVLPRALEMVVGDESP